MFGIANVLSYMLIFAPPFINPPFPFEHVSIVFGDDGRTWYQVTYFPIDAAIHDPYWLVWSLMLEAIHDPYWLVWSLMLYAGIAIMIVAAATQKLRGKF